MKYCSVADGCPEDNKSICCCECSVEGCCYRCEDSPETCGLSYEEQTPTELVPFQSKAMTVMKQIADLDLQKKQLEAQDKEVRQTLQKLMDEYGIKSFENDILKVTFIDATVRATIDSKRLKEELPAIAEKYTKRSTVKASVRIEVK